MRNVSKSCIIFFIKNKKNPVSNQPMSGLGMANPPIASKLRILLQSVSRNNFSEREGVRELGRDFGGFQHVKSRAFSAWNLAR